MTRNSRLLTLFAAVAAGALCSGVAEAQTAASSAAPAARADAGTLLGDIVVTARRREERIQDVPVAVTAIAGQDLARRSVIQITDLSRTVPGVTIGPGGFGAGPPRFAIRSQIQFEQLITLDPAVAVYFADVVQARAHGTNDAFFDLASVEVLKGPQGTLFGRNTTGGAVVVTPHAPTDQLEGYLQGILGNYSTRIFEGALNVPIGETLAVRVAGRVTKHDGYTKAPYAGTAFDDEDNQAWRAAVRWSPTSSFTNTLVVNGYHADQRGSGFRLMGVQPGSTFATRAPQLLTFLQQAGNQRLTGSENRNNVYRAKTLGMSNISTLDLGAVTLKNIYGYRKVKSYNDLDFDGSPFLIYSAPEGLREQQYSDEIQVLGKAFDDHLNWITGAYFFRETGYEFQTSIITVVPQNLYRVGFVRNTSKSVFAQGTYDLGLNGLSVTAGGRYTWDRRRFQEYGVNNLTGACTIVGAVAPSCYSGVKNAKFGAFTYNIDLDWKFAPDKLLYLAHRRGYRAGGFNLRASTPIQFVPFEPEYVKDVELGLKADWDVGGTRLRTNLAAYYQWYSNIQRSVSFVDPATGTLATNVINAATAHVKGFEAEVRWLPVSNLEISANAAHSALRYTRFQQALTGGAIQDLSANRIAFSPEWQGGGSVRYTQPLSGTAGSVAVQADIYAQSHMELQDLNVVGGRAPGYHIMNFRAEWNELLGTRISAAAYLRNAFNKKYFTAGFAINGLGPISEIYGAPRTYGVELRVPFGD